MIYPNILFIILIKIHFFLKFNNKIIFKYIIDYIINNKSNIILYYIILYNKYKIINKNPLFR